MSSIRPQRTLNFLEGQETALLISPQPWDGFRVSKHHYAIELANAGNQVFFLDPPVFNRFPGSIRTRPTSIPRLTVVEYQPLAPYLFRFHAGPIFDVGMRLTARRLRSRIGPGLSVVWDLDNTGSFHDLRWFFEVFRIFHPVDQLPPGWKSAKSADIVFSVAATIASCLSHEGLPIHIIPHGLNEQFLHYARTQLDGLAKWSTERNSPLTVGYVGNLASHAVDRPTISKLVEDNSEVRFEFYGPCQSSPPNQRLDQWIDSLRAHRHCTFHGLTPSARILEAAPRIHAWFLCYDSKLDINGGANSHKILEYLATGGEVVSSHLDAYNGLNLLHMPKTKSNQELPAIFRRCLTEWPGQDPIARRRRRLEFALSHSYKTNLAKIQEYCNARIRALATPAAPES